MRFKVLFIFVIVCLVSFNCKQSFRENFKKGMKAFSEGTLTQTFKKLLRTVHISRAFRQTETVDARTRQICIICEELIDTTIAQLQIGVPPKEVISRIVKLCIMLDFESHEVCTGFVKLNLMTIAFIFIGKPSLTGEFVCGILLQNFNCKTNFPELQVSIPKGRTIKGQKGKNSGTTPIKVLQLSDIHYDPHYLVGGRANCKEPLCCQVHKGYAPTSERGAGYWGDYGHCDTPKHFIDKAYAHIVDRHTDIDYIYFTGDIISHRVWDTAKKNNSIYIDDIYKGLYKTFPNIPIYPILGNHEPHPVNIFPPSLGDEDETFWVYKQVARLWIRNGLPQSTRKTILRGGYYTALVKPGFRIIALNSNVAYTFNLWILYETNTISAQLQWLADTLHKAEKKKEFVHILSHVPSGDDTAYIPYSYQFWRIVERFSNTITAIFNGHSHFDEWLLYHSKNEPSKAINIAWNGGSLTTYNDLNPNYKIYTVDGKNFEVLNFESWTFNLTLANMRCSSAPEWFQMYSCKEAYKLRNLSPKAIHDLISKTAKNESIMQAYYRYKHRDADTIGPCNKKCVLENLCRMVTLVHGDLEQCNKLQKMWNFRNFH